MFRVPRHLDKVDEVTFNLDTPITLPGNGQHQKKSDYKFFVRDRNNVYDWYNAYFSVDFTFEALADGANAAGDTRSAPINSAFSLIKDLVVNLFTKQATSTKSFSSKTCWTIRTIMQEPLRKNSFGNLTLTLQMLQPLP